MSEFDIDAEYENLLNAEKQKTPYIESLERERSELIALFREHVVAVCLSESDFSLEQIEVQPVEAEEREEDFYTELDELVTKDISRFEGLLDGEMQVSGEGVYILDFDGEGYPVEELALGEKIRGTVDIYGVAPLVNSDTSGDGTNFSGMPEIWVTLNDATLFGKNTEDIRPKGRMLIPLSLPSLKFGKVIRQFSEVAPNAIEVSKIIPEELPPTPKDSDIREQLAGHMFQERSNEIENDLNYNDYDKIEDLQVARRMYQAEINLYVADIEPEEELSLTVTGAMLPMGGTVDIVMQKAYYNGPTIMKFSNSWRIVHGFSVCSGNTGEQQLVHVYPETIISAFRSR